MLSQNIVLIDASNAENEIIITMRSKGNSLIPFNAWRSNSSPTERYNPEAHTTAAEDPCLKFIHSTVALVLLPFAITACGV